MKIFTIGHSTRSLKDFIKVLEHYNIQLLIDVRKFPASKKFPHFNIESLESELPKVGIEYLHFPDLAGFRKEGYQKFSESKEFFDAIEKLLRIVNGKITAIMCSEILFFRCHRRYIAEALVKIDNEVVHIYDENKSQEHKLRDKYIQEKMKVKIFCDKHLPKESSNNS